MRKTLSASLTDLMDDERTSPPAAKMRFEDADEDAAAAAAAAADGAPVTADDAAVSYALMMETIACTRQIIEKNMKSQEEMMVLMTRHAATCSALVHSATFRALKGLKREPEQEEIGQQAAAAAKEKITAAMVDMQRDKSLMASPYKTVAALLMSDAAIQLIRNICRDVAHQVETILRDADADPDEHEVPRRLQMLSAAMVDHARAEATRDDIRKAIFAIRRGKKKNEDGVMRNLGSFATFAKDTLGTSRRMTCAAADDTMRICIAEHRLKHGKDDVHHFEIQLSHRWGVPGLFRMSHGTLIINSEVFAAAVATPPKKTT
jgi:hypothetical protein